MDDYQFIIPNKKSAAYHLFAYGIILLNIATLGYFLSVSVYVIIGLIALIAPVEVFRYIKTKTLKVHYRGVVAIMGIGWLFTHYQWLFFLCSLLDGLYYLSTQKQIINILGQGVVYPSFPKKNIAWQHIGHVILKDDMLTIDLKNNKIYQHLIQYENELQINEAKFNEFCKKRLSANG